MKPLEFWRNERLVYGRSDGSPTSLPVIKGVIRPADPELPTVKHSRTTPDPEPRKQKRRKNDDDSHTLAGERASADDTHGNVSDPVAYSHLYNCTRTGTSTNKPDISTRQIRTKGKRRPSYSAGSCDQLQCRVHVDCLLLCTHSASLVNALIHFICLDIWKPMPEDTDILMTHGPPECHGNVLSEQNSL